MRVLQVLTSFYPAVRAGGTVFAPYALTRALARKGIDIVIYTTNLDAGEKLDVPVDRPVTLGNMRVYYHPVPGNNRYFFSPSLWRRLHRELDRFDLVHLHETWTFPILIMSSYCWRRGIPYIISPHGTLDTWCIDWKYLKKKIYFEFLGKSIYQHASAVHFTSEAERDNLSPKIPFKLNNPVIIPNPVDLDEYQDLPPKGRFRNEYNIPTDSPIILFVGRLHEKKGLDLLIKTFADLSNQEAMLLIVGPNESGYQKKLEVLVRELALGSRVIFTGPLTGMDKLAVYRDSSFLALPSHQENFGMVVAEAMAAELPVIISEHVNIAKDVQSAGAGLVLPLEPQCWTRAMETLLESAEGSRNMGLAGRKFALKHYSPSGVADMMLLAYLEIVEGRS